MIATDICPSGFSITSKGNYDDAYKNFDIIYKKDLEQIKAEEKLSAKKRKLIAQTNPGFKDLKPGLPKGDINNMSVCSSVLSGIPETCYEIDNLKFYGEFNKNQILTTLTVDLGPIVQSDGSFLTALSELVAEGETNIYLQMVENLGSKYNLEYDFLERDRQLFNEEEKEKLLKVYFQGQVALRMFRLKKEDSYRSKLWLHVEYRDVEEAKVFLEENRPKRAQSSDF